MLVTYADPVSAMTYHRSWSHSWFWLTLATPPLWLLARMLPGLRRGGSRLLLAIWLALVTHPLLDCMTVYGTQALQPFSDYPISVGSVFIIDPLFTLPLLVALAIALRRVERARSALTTALACCSVYLAAGAGAQSWIEAQARAATPVPGQTTAIKATPTPFNVARWRLLARTPSAYCDQFVFAWQRPTAGGWRCRAHDPALDRALSGHWPVARMRWFTHGWYAVRGDGDAVVLTDLRMGVEGYYVFRFVVGSVDGNRVRPVAARQLPTRRPELDELPRAYRHASTRRP